MSTVALEQTTDLITVEQAAKLLTVSRQTVYTLLNTGRIAYHRLGFGRGSIRLRRADLDEFIDDRRVEKAQPEAPRQPPPQEKLPPVAAYRHLRPKARR